MTPASLADDYFALRDDVGAVELFREAVAVTGPDARSFLQGQLSQDVDLAVGATAWALLLSPQGKMVAFVRVIRPAENEFILDVDGGWAAVVVERLLHFKLRVDADVAVVDDWKCVAVRGPRSADVTIDANSFAQAAFEWTTLAGVDLLGPKVALPSGVRPCCLEAYEALRIEAGFPIMGAEIKDSTIPAEAGIVERSVSFTKGCYTGQELVARIDSRGGNVPRRLRGVIVEPGAEVPVGAAIVVDGAEVGRITSTAFSPATESMVTLAYVGRKVEIEVGAVIRWETGTAAGTVTTLPIVRDRQGVTAPEPT